MEKVNPIPPSVEEMRSKYHINSDKCYNDLLINITAGIQKAFDDRIESRRIDLTFRRKDVLLAGFDRIKSYFSKYGYTLIYSEREGNYGACNITVQF